MDLAVDIGKASGTSLSYGDIDIAHRLKSRNVTSSPPFIISLVNRWRKEELIDRTKSLQPDASWWGVDPRIRVYANEQLSPKNQAILGEARKFKDFFFVWSWRAGIFCRPKIDGSQVQHLEEVNEATSLMDTLSAEQKETIEKANAERKANETTSKPGTPQGYANSGGNSNRHNGGSTGADTGAGSSSSNTDKSNRWKRSPYPSRKRH